MEWAAARLSLLRARRRESMTQCSAHSPATVSCPARPPARLNYTLAGASAAACCPELRFEWPFESVAPGKVETIAGPRNANVNHFRSALYLW